MTCHGQAAFRGRFLPLPLLYTHLSAKEHAMCECDKQPNNLSAAEVPDFSEAGFTASSEVSANAETFSAALATLQGVEALAVSGCVTARVSGNQVCFSIPIFGRFCFPSRVQIPAGAKLKACYKTCGSPTPTGIIVTIYLNDRPFFTIVIGRC